MIGYRCNVCGEKISEIEYEKYKAENNLKCRECETGFYESYFLDEGNGTITNKVKDIIKKADSLPGATKQNKVIGAVTGAIVGALIITGWFSFLGLLLGAGLGWVFAPYFVPWMRKVYQKIKKEIQFSDEDEKK